MLISCTSCYSKYLVNSMDLKPSGRKVECVNCGNQWFQENAVNENEENNTLESSLPDMSLDKDFKKNKKNIPIPNLPSTYVKEKKVSILNSILVILFIILLMGGLWIIQNLEMNTIVLFKYYLNEFYFNLKLIFNDIVKIIHKLFN